MYLLFWAPQPKQAVFGLGCYNHQPVRPSQLRYCLNFPCFPLFLALIKNPLILLLNHFIFAYISDHNSTSSSQPRRGVNKPVNKPVHRHFSPTTAMLRRSKSKDRQSLGGPVFMSTDQMSKMPSIVLESRVES